MPIDQDILTADAAMIEKIKAQDYRNWLLEGRRIEEARRAEYKRDVDSLIATRQEQVRLLQEQAAQLSPELTMRDRVTLAIADKYMTTSTATTPEAVQADAQKDAARLAAAVDAVLQVLQQP